MTLSIADVEIEEEPKWSGRVPVIVMDAALAEWAIRTGDAQDLLQTGLDALELSGATIIFLREPR